MRWLVASSPSVVTPKRRWTAIASSSTSIESSPTPAEASGASLSMSSGAVSSSLRASMISALSSLSICSRVSLRAGSPGMCAPLVDGGPDAVQPDRWTGPPSGANSQDRVLPPVALELAEQGGGADPEPPRGLGLVAADGVEHREDVLALDGRQLELEAAVIGRVRAGQLRIEIGARARLEPG